MNLTETNNIQVPNQKDRFRFDLLEPMRGIAVLMVMILHFAWAGKDSGDNLVFSRLWSIVHNGYLGVQVFFVISGYCITAAMIGGLGKPNAIGTFLYRRAKRILPPYWASMIFVVVTGWITILLLNTDRKIVFPLQPWEWISNIFLVQGPVGAQDANMVYWSLSIEAQFYIVMALCMFLGKKYCEIGLILFTLLSNYIHLMTTLPISGTILAYWTQFSAGMFLFFVLTKSHKFFWTPWVLLCLTILDAIGDYSKYGVLYYPDRGHLSQGVKIIFCLSMIPLMLLGQKFEYRLSKYKFYTLLAWFGMISYSLYLTHYIIGTRIINLGKRVTGLDGFKWMIYFFLCMIISTIGGYLFYILCEKPWLNTKVKTPSPVEPQQQ